MSHYFYLNKYITPHMELWAVINSIYWLKLLEFVTAILKSFFNIMDLWNKADATSNTYIMIVVYFISTDTYPNFFLHGPL